MFAALSAVIQMLAIAIGAAAATLIGATVIPPHRVTQVEVARIGGTTDHAAGNRAGRRAQSRIAGRTANNRTTGRAKQRTRGDTVTRVGSATREGQGRHGCNSD
jgi:hypothetical protein